VVTGNEWVRISNVELPASFEVLILLQVGTARPADRRQFQVPTQTMTHFPQDLD
jgi:hypothetical protein